MKRIAMLQATYKAIQPMTDAFAAAGAEVELLNFVNENMLAAVNRRGGVGKKELRMFMRLALEAMEIEPDCILVCCSIFCSYVPLLRELTSAPVIAINTPMLTAAAEIGGKIGVVSTTPTSGPHTEEQIREILSSFGRTAEFVHAIVPEAIAALKQGDAERHDTLIAGEVQRLISAGCSCVLLSQITMASARKRIADTAVPILTSPEEGVKEVLRILQDA